MIGKKKVNLERARIVLHAADGLQDKQVAAELSITPEKAARWRNRLLERVDGPAEGCAAARRARTTTDQRIAEVVEKTTQEKPDNATHWSTRTMAEVVGFLSEASIRRIWHAHGSNPIYTSCRMMTARGDLC